MIPEKRNSNGVGAEDMGYKQPDKLRAVGLDEKTLRTMEPDERVEALEKANLDPYDFIYLAC